MESEILSYDPSFLRKRIFKIQEENLKLKSDLLNIENDLKPQIQNLKDEVNKYKIENVNLNFELNTKEQKIAELLNKITLLENYNKESNEKMEKLKDENTDLKQKFSCQNQEIEKNKNINEQMKLDNKALVMMIKDNNLKIEELKEENNNLIKELEEVQNNLNNIITPQLRRNEENVMYFQENIDKLLIENNNLKEDNLTLIDQNKKQCDLIANLKNKIKTYINDGQNIFNKDFKFFGNEEIPNKRTRNSSNYYDNCLNTEEPFRDNFSNSQNINITENRSTYQYTNEEKLNKNKC